MATLDNPLPTRYILQSIEANNYSMQSGTSRGDHMGEFKLIIIPDEDEIDGAEVCVDGTIGGNTYRFLLDTGAGRTRLIFDDYTSTLNRIGQNDPSSGVFASSTDDMVQIPSIEVGPISRQDIALSRAPETQIGVRNLIGMDLLKDYSCHFLFDEDRVSVDEDALCGADYPFQPLFLDKKFHPYIDVQLGTATAGAVWDTGASITVVNMALVEKHSDFFEAAGHSTGTDSTGMSVETPMFVMAATDIGGYTFPSQRVAGVDLSFVNTTIERPMDLILGYSLLRKANWLFDFPRQKWAITKQMSSG
jgi:hypothetical protein